MISRVVHPHDTQHPVDSTYLSTTTAITFLLIMTPSGLLSVVKPDFRCEGSPCHKPPIYGKPNFSGAKLAFTQH